MTTDPLAGAARAWDALRRHAGAAEGSEQSRAIARGLMAVLCQADVPAVADRETEAS